MATPELRTVKPKGAKSPLWEFFGFEIDVHNQPVDKERKTDLCKVCSSAVGYSGNTSNLKQHLHIHHPELLPGPSGLQGQQRKQSTLEECSTAVKARRLTGKQVAGITNALASFLAKDLRPISLVEGEGFRSFMSVVEPSYQVPCRKTITHALGKIHQDVKAKNSMVSS